MKELIAFQIQGTNYGEITPKLVTGNSLIPSDNAAGLVSLLITLGLYIGGVLMLSWMGWGVFQYIFAGGNKDRLAQARKRIIFSVVGFIILVLAFTLSNFLRQVFQPQSPSVQTVTAPSPSNPAP